MSTTPITMWLEDKEILSLEKCFIFRITYYLSLPLIHTTKHNSSRRVLPECHGSDFLLHQTYSTLNNINILQVVTSSLSQLTIHPNYIWVTLWHDMTWNLGHHEIRRQLFTVDHKNRMREREELLHIRKSVDWLVSWVGWPLSLYPAADITGWTITGHPGQELPAWLYWVRIIYF